MAACNQMATSYTFQQSGDGNGVYTTASNLNNNVYTYWRDDAWHFTFVPTQNGLGDQGTMANQHISIPIPGTGFNLSVFFAVNGTLTGNNLVNLPNQEQQAAQGLLTQYTPAFQAMAQEMINQLEIAPAQN